MCPARAASAPCPGSAFPASATGDLAENWGALSLALGPGRSRGCPGPQVWAGGRGPGSGLLCPANPRGQNPYRSHPDCYAEIFPGQGHLPLLSGCLRVSVFRAHVCAGQHACQGARPTTRGRSRPLAPLHGSTASIILGGHAGQGGVAPAPVSSAPGHVWAGARRLWAAFSFFCSVAKAGRSSGLPFQHSNMSV